VRGNHSVKTLQSPCEKVLHRKTLQKDVCFVERRGIKRIPWCTGQRRKSVIEKGEVYNPQKEKKQDIGYKTERDRDHTSTKGDYVSAA